MGGTTSRVIAHHLPFFCIVMLVLCHLPSHYLLLPVVVASTFMYVGCSFLWDAWSSVCTLRSSRSICPREETCDAGFLGFLHFKGPSGNRIPTWGLCCLKKRRLNVQCRCNHQHAACAFPFPCNLGNNTQPAHVKIAGWMRIHGEVKARVFICFLIRFLEMANSKNTRVVCKIANKGACLICFLACVCGLVTAGQLEVEGNCNPTQARSF
jgi:hypothetical protein